MGEGRLQRETRVRVKSTGERRGNPDARLKAMIEIPTVVPVNETNRDSLGMTQTRRVGATHQ